MNTYLPGSRQTFGKDERLSGSKAIARLFEDGQSLLVYPVKVIWMKSVTQHPLPAQVAFAVSRRIFNKAVDRNLLKRRMKESYRMNKASFYSSCGPEKITLLFVYVSREMLPFEPIEQATRTALHRLLYSIPPSCL